jgi:hypothetical protein
VVWSVVVSVVVEVQRRGGRQGGIGGSLWVFEDAVDKRSVLGARFSDRLSILHHSTTGDEHLEKTRALVKKQESEKQENKNTPIALLLITLKRTVLA